MKPSKNYLRDDTFTDDPKEKILKDIFAKFREIKANVGHTLPPRWLSLYYYPSLNPKEQEFLEIAIKELGDDNFVEYTGKKDNLRLKEKGYDEIY